jgi:hypothetical protein
LGYFETEYLGLNIPAEGEQYFDDPSLIAGCDLDLTLEHLKFARKLKSAKFTLAALEEIHSDSLSTFVKIKRMMDDSGATVTTAKSMVDSKCSNLTEITPLHDITNKVIAQSEAVLWAVKNRDQILLAKQKVQDKRLASELGFDKGPRVTDDLDRFFFRILGELRKQQEWRYRRDAIVMA